MFKVLFLVGLVALVNAHVGRVPIYRQQKFIKTLEHVRAEKNMILSKYNMLDTDAAKCVEDIDSSLNLELYGEISVGTPPQKLKITFDTASTILWVLSTQNCNYQYQDCTYQYGFNPNASSTFEMVLNGQYITNNIQGYRGIDNVQVADLTIQSQIFAVIYLTSIYHTDGYFGLGNGNSGSSPLAFMAQQGIINSELFSIYMSKNESELAGEILFGTIDDSLYNGKLSYINLVNDVSLPNAWVIPIQSVSIGNYISTNGTAQFDSVTDMIGCPIEVLIYINENMHSTINANNDIIVSCSSIASLPNFEIAITDNFSITLTPNDYIFVSTSNNEEVCISKFTYSGGNNWIFGTPILQNQYTVFDATNKQIGLAHLS